MKGVTVAQTIVSVFKYQEGVEAAIKQLKDLGYNPSEFSIVMKDVHKREEIENNTAANMTKGALSGALTGGILAGVAGLVVGLGLVTLPGLGAVVVAGPIATALGLTGAAATVTTATVTGAVGGGLIGGLIGTGFSREDAAKYEEFVRAGGILLIVPARDVRTDEVRDILAKHGATDIRQLDLHAQTSEYKPA